MSEPVSRPDDAENPAGTDGKVRPQARNDSRGVSPARRNVNHGLGQGQGLDSPEPVFDDGGQGRLDLQLPDTQAARGEVFRSAANEDAFDRLALWPHWPSPWLGVVGPRYCGLTTMAVDFAARTGVMSVHGHDFDALDEAELAPLARGGVAIDDAHVVQNGMHLLRLMNAAQETGGTVVLFAHSRPGGWEIDPPDLVSRLRATPIVEIAPPDLALMAMRLRAAARAQFIHMDGEVARYFALRLARRYGLIEPVIRITRDTLAETGHRLTTALARNVLAQVRLGGGEDMVPGLGLMGEDE